MNPKKSILYVGKPWQISIFSGLSITLFAAIVFWSFSVSHPKKSRDRFLFSEGQDVSMIKTPSGHYCPDGHTDGNNLIVEIFHTDVIDRDRVPNDGRYFLALTICLPLNVEPGDVRSIRPHPEPNDQFVEPPLLSVLQQDEFSAIFFAGGCYFPVASPPKLNRVQVLKRGEEKILVHVKLSLKFQGIIGDIEIDNDYELRRGMYTDIPLSVRAAAR